MLGLAESHSGSLVMHKCSLGILPVTPLGGHEGVLSHMLSLQQLFSTYIRSSIETLLIKKIFFVESKFHAPGHPIGHVSTGGG
jgi:hypothetical protein